MKLTTLSAAVAAVVALSQGAQAHERHHHHFSHRATRSHHWIHHHYADRHRRHGGHRYAGSDTRRHWARRHDHDWSESSPGSGHLSRHGRRHFERSAYHGGYGPRPAEWCGWEMRQLVSSDPGPSYNLARNWARWGRPGPAGIGAVVVWSHHVGKIVGRQGGEWIVESGNDGRRVRVRPRSIVGAIAIRWG